MSLSSARMGAPPPPQPSNNLKPCDLVMKGGITSGIVYPPALLQLKEQYTFRNIGGTSAGAIAAAGAAAAEYRRNNGGGNAGFDYLEEHVQKWLGTGSNLLNLFQASRETKPLFDFALALLPTPPAPATQPAAPVAQNQPPTPQTATKPSPLQPFFKVLRVWLFNYSPFSWGAVLFAIFTLILFASPPLMVFAIVYMVSITSAAHSVVWFTIAAVILGIVGAWFGWHIGGLVSAVRSLPGNFYSICTGHTTKPDSALDFTNLTDWLSKVFNEMAGKDLRVPLTFGDLKDKGMNLKMVTSNLNHGLPYVMPAGLHNFIFKKSEMLKLFPQYVVDHMVRNQPGDPLIPRDNLPLPPKLPSGEEDGYYYLPDEEKLPVIVCTRMSLCFPILLSAVPLYTISTQAYNDVRAGLIEKLEDDPKYNHLQLNWFSDGGICSNFPIEFFDAWLPRWPTFGINLTSLSSANSTSALQDSGVVLQSAKAAAGEKDPEPVYLPRAEDAQDPEWDKVEGLLNFALAIFGTAQNYRETMQANLPSYRERIVQVRLNDDEGGLNLAMPKQIIDKIVQKGNQAGTTLCDPNQFNLDHHIWVRFIVLMAQLENNLIGMQEVLRSPDFEARLKQQVTSKTSPDPQSIYPYWRDEDWTKDVVPRIEALRTLIHDWNIDPMDKEENKPCFFRKDAPVPVPILRVAPEI